ncbi:MAG: DUF2191 domain-containing protein [Actinobacteria bacterium]|nr:DUF2191 domain-containing protein [Actinomycetota bacterium]
MSKRTTLTLEDDVAHRLLEESRRSGKSLKDVVNEVIRAGLARRPTTLPPFKVKARPMGLKPGFDLDDIEGLLDQLEGPYRR